MTRLAQDLGDLGLMIAGVCDTTDADKVGAGALHLLAPDETRFWGIFAASPEYADGQPDPMDRWSARVIAQLAASHGATAIFPFGGPPFHPFFSWALRSGVFWTSPINFLVHASAGLMVSFRGALLFAGPQAAASAPALRPCETCLHPCTNACPVDAFADGYDVVACRAHINSDAGAPCRNFGCLARRACPVGQGLRVPAQAQFHMEAFR